MYQLDTEINTPTMPHMSSPRHNVRNVHGTSVKTLMLKFKKKQRLKRQTEP